GDRPRTVGDMIGDGYRIAGERESIRIKPLSEKCVTALNDEQTIRIFCKRKSIDDAVLLPAIERRSKHGTSRRIQKATAIREELRMPVARCRFVCPCDRVSFTSGGRDLEDRTRIILSKQNLAAWAPCTAFAQRCSREYLYCSCASPKPHTVL